MILVTGATGYVGNQLVKQLSAAGVPVRALARKREKAEAIAGPGVEVVEGDFEKQETLDVALEGVEKAFLLSSSGPQTVELQGNFIRAARRAGTRHVVKLSSGGADVNSPAVDGQWHGKVEKQLEESGMAWTHLRPSFFMQNIEKYFGSSIRNENAFYAPLENVKAALVDIRDIATVAAAVLTESGHEGKASTVTGSEALSFYEVAEKLSAVLGKQVTYVDVPMEEYKKQMREAGQPEWLVTVITNIPVGFARGGSEVTNVVREVAKKQPISFSQFARDFAPAFKGN